jgi:hypothetical protein
MFKFPSKTDQQLEDIKNRGLLPDGVYPFRVKSASLGQSNAGNEMISLVIGVVFEGEERNIKDWLVSMDTMIYKIKHFCEAVGLEDKYLAGEFGLDDCSHKTGYVRLGIQKGKPRDDGGMFPDKNSVADYVKPSEVPEGTAKVGIDPTFNDDIPF